MTSLKVTVALVIMTTLSVLLTPSDAHGRLMDPPARNSMWRLGFNNPTNYNDNELYCGGRMVQWLRNSGKCGVCGDPYHGKKDHEVGGVYANAIITRSYHEGDVIPVTVHLTANHLGWFEFRICPVNDPKKRVTQKCLDKFPLQRPDGKGMKYFVPKGKYNAFFNYTVQLPKGMTCKRCVMQWKYRTGNTWDKDDKSGLFCLGCGPQEEFYNCADIEILKKGVKTSWSKEDNMRPTTTPPPPTVETKGDKSIKEIVESKQDIQKLNAIHQSHMKKSPKETFVNKEGNSIISHPTARRKSKTPKHPQDVKYTWRASTPWLLRRRNWLNRRRLGLKEKHKKLVQSKQANPNTVQDRESRTNSPGPKVLRKPTVQATTTTVKPPTKKTLSRKPVSRKPISIHSVKTSSVVPRTTVPQKKTSPIPVRSTKMRMTVTNPPKMHSLKDPSKSWLITRKQPQSPFKRPTEKVKVTTRTVTKTTGPQPSLQKVKVLTKDPHKATTHNCITEKPRTKPVQKKVFHRTQAPRQDKAVEQNDVQVYQQRKTTPHSPDYHAEGDQKVISFQPVISQQPVIDHRPMLQQQQHHTQRPYPAHSTNPITAMWWSQYQRPVSYFWNRPAVAPLLKCRATITLGGGMDEWCTANCNANFCPGGLCICQPDDQPYPSFSMYPAHTQPWGNTYSPSINQYQSQHRVSAPSQSLSPFAPRRDTLQRQRKVHEQRQQAQRQQTQRQQAQRQQAQRQQAQQILRQQAQRQRLRNQQREQTLRKRGRKQTSRQQQQHSQSPIKTSRSIFTPPTKREPSKPTEQELQRETSGMWSQKGKYYCKATGRYSGLSRFDDWCRKNCMNVICPLLICECHTL